MCLILRHSLVTHCTYKELGGYRLFYSETVVSVTSLTNKMLGIFKNRFSNNILFVVWAIVFYAVHTFGILHVVFTKMKFDYTVEA